MCQASGQHLKCPGQGHPPHCPAHTALTPLGLPASAHGLECVKLEAVCSAGSPFVPLELQLHSKQGTRGWGHAGGLWRPLPFHLHPPFPRTPPQPQDSPPHVGTGFGDRSTPLWLTAGGTPSCPEVCQLQPAPWRPGPGPSQKPAHKDARMVLPCPGPVPGAAGHRLPVLGCVMGVARVQRPTAGCPCPLRTQAGWSQG